MNRNADSFFDDFFAPSYDAVKGECKCLECLKKSSKDGGGKWVAGRTLWVCDGCLPAREAREQAEQQEIEEVKQRFSDGSFANEDLTFLVDKGLAHKVYDDPESNRPTGIEMNSSGSPYADQVDE